MAPNGQRQDTKYWYKISIDAVRAWATLFTVLAIAAGGFWGYRLLSQHFLERELLVAIEESEDLLEQLATESDIEAHRERMDMASGHLGRARSLYEAGQLRDARDEAERSRTLLTAVSNALLHRNPSGEAQFIAIQGRVEVRRGERGEWLPARSRMYLNVGDYVKTSSNGSAEGMMVDGTLFTVRPNTVLLVTRTRSVLGLRNERTLSLESGWVNLSTAQTESRITTPDAAATVRERSEAVVAWDEESGSGSFSSYRGGLQVAARDGTTRDIGELESVEQSNGDLSEVRALPEAPILTAPRDNLELSLESAETVRLAWQPVEGAGSYALQVSQSRLFVDNVIDVENRTKTSATLGLRGEGSFVWRVAATDTNGRRGPWSSIHHFRVGAAPGSPESSNDIRGQEG